MSQIQSSGVVTTRARGHGKGVLGLLLTSSEADLKLTSGNLITKQKIMPMILSPSDKPLIESLWETMND
jgi:hypothetical protein